MPLTPSGRKIKAAMQAEYGDEKGEEVFYASRSSGKIKGVEAMREQARKLREALFPHLKKGR